MKRATSSFHRNVILTLFSLGTIFYSTASFAELPFSGALETSLGTNSLTDTNNGDSLSQDFSLSLYKMFDKKRLLVESSVTKDWKDEQKWTLNDPSLVFSHPLEDNEFSAISLSESVLIGASEESRKNTTFLFNLRLSGNFTLKDKAFLIDGFRMVYSPSIRKSFHRNETTASGRSNFEWTLAHKLSFNYDFLEKFYIRASASYQRSWTYGTNYRDRIDHAQSIGMSFTENLSGEIGHSYGSSPLTPDGKDYRVNFYDPRSSTVYISLGFSF